MKRIAAVAGFLACSVSREAFAENGLSGFDGISTLATALAVVVGFVGVLLMIAVVSLVVPALRKRKAKRKAKPDPHAAGASPPRRLTVTSSARTASRRRFAGTSSEAGSRAALRSG